MRSGRRETFGSVGASARCALRARASGGSGRRARSRLARIESTSTSSGLTPNTRPVSVASAALMTTPGGAAAEPPAEPPPVPVAQGTLPEGKTCPLCRLFTRSRAPTPSNADYWHAQPVGKTYRVRGPGRPRVITSAAVRALAQPLRPVVIRRSSRIGSPPVAHLVSRCAHPRLLSREGGDPACG